MTTLAALLETDTERWRYQNLLRTLMSWRALFAGQRVLDFGAAWGTSAVALIEAGAGEVVGVEPDQSRVEKGRALIAQVAPGAKISLLYVGDTSSLPFRDAEFTFVLANGVLEHIPQPRDPYVRELWRVLAHDGYLMVTETPNTYWPCDTHTTGFWFNHWLPRDMAHRRAVRRGRFRSNRHDWATSGWRGVGYRELVRPLAGYRLVHDNTVEAPIVRLASYLAVRRVDRVDLIRIDVEGAEHPVIAGFAESWTFHPRPVMVIEVHPASLMFGSSADTLFATLRGAGCGLQRLRERATRGAARALRRDFLGARKARPRLRCL